MDLVLDFEDSHCVPLCEEVKSPLKDLLLSLDVDTKAHPLGCDRGLADRSRARLS
jgi:hypothetical protein